MALDAGVLKVTIEFAKGLKVRGKFISMQRLNLSSYLLLATVLFQDAEWFGKMDPYAMLKVGGQVSRTGTASSGGTSPVWNETFSFNVINENSLEIT